MEHKAKQPAQQPAQPCRSFPWKCIIAFWIIVIIAVASCSQCPQTKKLYPQARELYTQAKQLYTFFNPKISNTGLSNYYSRGSTMDLYVYASAMRTACITPELAKACTLVLHDTNFVYTYNNVAFTRDLILPDDLIRVANQTHPIFLHVWLTASGIKPPSEGGRTSHNKLIYQVGMLNAMMKPMNKSMSWREQLADFDDPRERKLHIAREINFMLIVDENKYLKETIPEDLKPGMRTVGKKKYTPAFAFNRALQAKNKYAVLNSKVDTKLPVTLKITLNSVGGFRLYVKMLQLQSYLLSKLRRADYELDFLRSIVSKNNEIPFLVLTILMLAIHALFDFFALISDMLYWNKRVTMKGLSTRAVILEAVAQCIVAVQLWESGSSLWHAIPSAIVAIVTLWKLKRVLKIRTRVGKSEMVTEEADIVATKYMTFTLCPLMIAYFHFSFSLTKSKDVEMYSWILRTLAGFIKTFGVVMIMPQLFINYRVKSAVHLPWTTLCFKAFNGFMDDIFIFLDRPTLPQLACYRYEVIFVLFLLQLAMYGFRQEKSVDEKAEDTKPETENDNENEGELMPSANEPSPKARKRL